MLTHPRAQDVPQGPGSAGSGTDAMSENSPPQKVSKPQLQIDRFILQSPVPIGGPTITNCTNSQKRGWGERWRQHHRQRDDADAPQVIPGQREESYVLSLKVTVISFRLVFHESAEVLRAWAAWVPAQRRESQDPSADLEQTRACTLPFTDGWPPELAVPHIGHAGFLSTFVNRTENQEANPWRGGVVRIRNRF